MYKMLNALFVGSLEIIYNVLWRNSQSIIISEKKEQIQRMDFLFLLMIQ